MATGLGKTVTFANIPRRGRMLILSHREELVEQPRKYFSCSYGVERAQYHSHGEEVVGASVQTLVRRLERFGPSDFDIVIVDECHHAAACTYRKITDYFKPRLLLGFTATVNRADSARLDTVFDKIIFQRDLRWGIVNGYLSDIYCLRCDIGFDLRGVHTQNGDYAPGELDEAMNGTADAIAEAYRDHAVGATLIFAVNVRHAQEIAGKIPGAVVVTGETRDRASIVDAFTRGEIPCIVNCMVFTEGTDIPRVETVIMARPTQSDSLYCLDTKTEIMTPDGWKNDVKVGDLVGAFDAATGEIKFVPAIAKVRRKLEPDEYFCSISGPSNDIRVTDKHRVLYRTRQGTWMFRTAAQMADLRDGARIPASGHTKFPGVPLTDDEIRFIGWVMTDGCINKINNAISITQSSTQSWIDEIQRVIDSCGFKYGKHIGNSKTQFNRNGDNIIWTISKGAPRGRDKDKRGWSYLEPWISKDMSPKLFDMTEEQFDIMLEVIHMADGHKQHSKDWTQRSYHIGKGNKTFIERLQMMAIQRGYRANLAVQTQNRQNPYYMLHMKKEDFIHIGSKYDTRPQWVKEPHTDEECWCVQTELGTIVTRRNGKAVILGNCQCVGRGLRLYPGKERLTLIDCVGVTGSRSLVTAPSLLGIDLDSVPQEKRNEVQGMLFDLPDLATAAADCPQSWIRNTQIVDLWAKDMSYNLHDMNLFKQPDGSLTLSLPNRVKKTIPPADRLGNVTFKNGVTVPMQTALDKLYKQLCKDYPEDQYIWDLNQVKRWANKPASEEQVKLVQRKCKGYDTTNMTKGEASLILNRVLNR